MLLVRQPSWDTDRFSCVAGFLEGGETIEQCVKRELEEEVGVRVLTEDVSYKLSHFWPTVFSSNLMLVIHHSLFFCLIYVRDVSLAFATEIRQLLSTQRNWKMQFGWRKMKWNISWNHMTILFLLTLILFPLFRLDPSFTLALSVPFQVPTRLPFDWWSYGWTRHENSKN